MLLNKLELLEALFGENYTDELSIFKVKDTINHIPIKYRGLYVPLGYDLEIINDVGCFVGNFPAFKPVEGGTVVYLKW